MLFDLIYSECQFDTILDVSEPHFYKLRRDVSMTFIVLSKGENVKNILNLGIGP